MSNIPRSLEVRRIMAVVLREKGEYAESEEELKSVLEESREVGSKYEECVSMYELGVLKTQKGEDAKKYFGESFEIATKHGFEIFAKRIRETEEVDKEINENDKTLGKDRLRE